MKAGSIILILVCLSLGALYAHELNEELYIDEFADIRQDETYQSFEPYSIGFSGAFKLANHPYFINSIHIKSKSWKIQGGIKIANIKPHFGAYPDPYVESSTGANIQLSYNDMLYLGALRPAWGSGLLFAESKSGKAFQNAPDPMNYTPFGLGVRLKKDEMHVLALYSATGRMALLRDGKIDKLYRNKEERDFKVEEQIAAMGIGYEGKAFEGAVIFSRQYYPTEFYDESLENSLLNLNLMGGYHTENSRVGGEIAFQKHGYALKAEWDGKWDNFRHKLYYRLLDDYQLPAYAKRVYFNQQQFQEELGAEIAIDLDTRSTLKLSSKANKLTQEPTKRSWMLNSGVEYIYRDSRHKLNLAIRRIDRELLALHDEVYLSSIPANWRFLLGGEVRVANSLAITQSARYHHQEKKASLNSGFIWEQGMKWERERFWAKVGMRMHNSTNFKMIVLSDDEDGYESLSKNGIRGELELGIKQNDTKLMIRITAGEDSGGIYILTNLPIHRLP